MIKDSVENKGTANQLLNKGTANQLLGDYIIMCLNSELRATEPTPNNPDSSRSHVIIHIKIKNSNPSKISNLVVCDFAGVENEFDCSNDDVINIFNQKIKESSLNPLGYIYK